MQETVKEAYQLIKSGDKQQGRKLLESVLKSDRDNIQAWWLYASVATNKEQAGKAVHQILRLDPNHSGALKFQEKYQLKSDSVAQVQNEEQPINWMLVGVGGILLTIGIIAALFSFLQIRNSHAVKAEITSKSLSALDNGQSAIWIEYRYEVAGKTYETHEQIGTKDREESIQKLADYEHDKTYYVYYNPADYTDVTLKPPTKILALSHTLMPVGIVTGILGFGVLAVGLVGVPSISLNEINTAELSTKMPSYTFMAGVVCAGIGVLAILPGAFLMVANRGTSVKGDITKTYITQSGAAVEFGAVYQYEVDGKTYRHEEPVELYNTWEEAQEKSEGKIDLGKDVRVYYDPDNPAEASIQKPAGMRTGQNILMGGILAMIVGAALAWTGRLLRQI